MNKGPVSKFIEHHFRHFNAAALVDAAKGYEKHLEEGGKMMITLAGAMSTAEMGVSLAEMIRQDKVHMLTVGLTSAFANDPKVNASVLQSFEKEFSFVKDAKWTVGDEYSKAVFILSDRRIEAYFSNEGEYLGSARDLIFNQLPMAVINAINKRFGDIGVYEIIERSNNGETLYYMTVDYANKILRVEATPSGGLSIIKKIRKENSK